jgi:hypothetical protein
MSLLPREDVSVPLLVPEAEFYSRLNEGLVPTKLRLLFRNGFVGSASASSVKVRWARRFVSNDLAPQFEGRVTPDHKFVRGSFRQRGLVLALLFVSVALGFAGIVVGIAVGMRAPMNSRWVAAAVIGLIGFAAWLPRLGWVMARSDVERITEALRAAARGESPRRESR